MTSLYDVPLLKGEIAITCPRCAARARFRTPGGGPLPVRWQRPDYNATLGPWHGVASCVSCGFSGVHSLDWPSDAWFQTEVGGTLLWALDSAMLEEIRRFIAGTDDRAEIRRGGDYAAALHRLPAELLKAGRREEVLRKIDRLLEGEAISGPES